MDSAGIMRARRERAAGDYDKIYRAGFTTRTKMPALSVLRELF